jgi:hypothetical protein
MILQSRSHYERARDEARRYLARYPNGFAVDEARRVVDTP